MPLNILGESTKMTLGYLPIFSHNMAVQSLPRELSLYMNSLSFVGANIGRDFAQPPIYKTFSQLQLNIQLQIINSMSA